MTPEKYKKILEIDTLARTMWGEARGQGESGLQAVANVVMNRVAEARKRRKYWWGNDVIGVCQKPFQFSCWNIDDPNRPKAIAVDKKNRDFCLCLKIAEKALSGKLPDVTNGATHYHTKAISPYWARGESPCAVIGDHVFYRIL